MDNRGESLIAEEFDLGVGAFEAEQWVDAERIFVSVLSKLPRTPTSNLGWALMFLGGAEYGQERFASAERHYREGIDVFRRAQDIESLADAKRRLGVLLASSSPQLDAALREFGEARRLAFRAHKPVMLARIDESAGFALLDRGRPADAYDHIVRAHAEYTQLEMWTFAAQLSVRAGQGFGHLGHREWATRFTEQADREWEEHDLPGHAADALIRGQSLLERAHRHDESLAAKQRALDESTDPATSVAVRLSIVDELIHLGRIDEAARQIFRCVGLMRSLPDDRTLAGRLIVDWSTVLRLSTRSLRSRLAARWLIPWGRSWLEENADTDWPLEVDVAKFLGMLCRRFGRHREAVALLTSAREHIPAVREVVAYACVISLLADAKLDLALSRDGRDDRDRLLAEACDESVAAAIIVDSLRHNLDSSDWRAGWIHGVRTLVASTAFRATALAGDAHTLAGLVESLRGGGGLSMPDDHGVQRGLADTPVPVIVPHAAGADREATLTAGAVGFLGTREFVRTVPGPNVVLPGGALALAHSISAASAEFRTAAHVIRQPIRVPVA